MAYLGGKEVAIIAAKGERGEPGLCAPLASIFLGWNSEKVIFDIDNLKVTFPEDTVVVGNGGKTYNLKTEHGNREISIATRPGNTSCIKIIYQVSSGMLVLKAYNEEILIDDDILLAVVRVTGGNSVVSITCPYVVVWQGVGYTNRIAESSSKRSSFVAPLICGQTDKFVEVDTVTGTITFPDDTLIIDPCHDGNESAAKSFFYQLATAKGNNTLNYKELTGSSAVKIWYNPATDSLTATQYNVLPSAFENYILIAVMRTTQKTLACTMPYKVDGLLNGIDYYDYVKNRSNDNIRSVNHRGYNQVAPENTLSAYRLSKKNGFEYVECDVSFTKDGVPVLLHDDTIDRTSNGTGSITALTFEEVRALDFGSWKSTAYAGEKIPSFEEFIVLCKRLGLKPYIELKGTPTKEQVRQLVTIVTRYGMYKNSTWISFSHELLNYVNEFDSTARLGLVTPEIFEGNISWVKSVKTANNDVFLNVMYSGLTGEGVSACITDNIPIEVWTVNNESEMLALDAYVSGYSSDNLVASEIFYKNNIA